jgi:hypothetical protein
MRLLFSETFGTLVRASVFMADLIHTSTNGKLDSTSEEDIRGLLKRAFDQERPVVVHIHGGRVKREDAEASAKVLQPFYEAKGIFPVFLIWETGLFESLRNWTEAISRESVFEFLLTRLTKFLKGRLSSPEAPGAKAAFGAAEPTLAEAKMKVKEAYQSKVIYPELDSVEVTKELSEEAEAKLRAEIKADVDLVTAWREEVEKDRDATSLAPDIWKQARKTEATPEGKALLDPITLAAIAGRIAFRVIRRYARHRDHGFHATLVEEILRAVYVGKLGTTVWAFMKTDAADTFKKLPGEATRGGWFLVQEIGRLLRDHPKTGTFRLSLVGHSAGAIYAARLLDHWESCRRDSRHPLHNSGVAVDKLVFLAPAITYQVFSATLQAHLTKPLLRDFRMFSMTDADEAGYWEIPGVYPRSLLYLISGILEGDEDDCPLVGMQRYLRDTPPYSAPVFPGAGTFLKDVTTRSVWSDQTTGADGLICDSTRHGGFSAPDTGTMRSVAHFIKA